MVDNNKGYKEAEEEIYNGKPKENDKDDKAKVLGENPRARRDH